MDFSREELEQGIQNDEFELHYQPIISLRELNVSGVEALLRWQHPEHGVLQTDHFLNELRTTGLLIEAAEQVIEESFTEWKDWISQDLVDESLFININLSKIELTSDQYVSTLQHSMEQLQPELKKLYVEIHEDRLLDLLENHEGWAKRIESIPNIEFCVDDFGLNNPSMEKLASLPVSAIKLDRDFVNPENPTKNHLKIIEHLIDFAKDCGVTVFSEGIQTSEDFENFYKFGCDFAQGAYFSKPTSGEHSWSLNEEQLKSVVHELGGPRTSTISKTSNIKIFDQLSVLLAAPSTPIRKMLDNALSDYELTHQTESSVEAIRDAFKNFSWKTLVIDDNIADQNTIHRLASSYWQSNPDGHVIILGGKTELPNLDSPSDTQKFHSLQKPVDLNDFLRILSQISFRMDQVNQNENGRSAWTSHFTDRSRRFYVLLFVGFVLFGVALGYALTAVRKQMSSMSQRSQSMSQKLNRVLNSVEDLENKEEILDSPGKLKELKEKKNSP